VIVVAGYVATDKLLQGRCTVYKKAVLIQMFDGFWDNVFRYPRYFLTTLLGVLLNTFAPLLPLFKRPVTLIALIGLFGSSLVFVTLTLRAMLGLDAG
jgi:membrane protein insertase Oxa1/YidC/SpoIIIJ